MRYKPEDVVGKDASELFPDGPQRVVIDEHGTAVPPRRGGRPLVVFIRDDGWLLGALSGLEQVAYDMWSKEWVGFVSAPSLVIQPMEEY